MSDIFREIDDELRRENLLQLWSRYSRYIIAAAVLLALIVGGIFAWRQHLASERLAQANRYTAALALARQNKEQEAAKLFATLANGGGYGIPAGFQEAALLAKAGDRQGAIAAYDRLAASCDGRSRIPRPGGFVLGHAPASRTAIRRPRSSGSRL